MTRLSRQSRLRQWPMPCLVWDCRRGPRRRDHDGGARRATGRDRPQGRGGPGRDFLGILLCYGVFGPISRKLASMNTDDATYYNCLRTGLASFVKGAPPILAVEFARRSLPHAIRPTFKEAEDAVRGGVAPGPLLKAAAA